MRELRQGAAMERKLLGVKGSGFSLADRATLDQAITFCTTVLGPADVAEVVMEIGDIHRNLGDLLRAEELYTLAIAQGDTCDDQSVMGEGFLRRGDLYSRQGRWKESSADLNESRRIYKRMSNRSGLGRVENIIGTNFAIQGKLKKAKSSYAHALAAFEKSEELLMTGTVLMNLGIVHNILGFYDKALGYYRRAESYFTRTGNVQRLMELHHNMGMSQLYKEAYTDAMKQFDMCIKYATRLHHVNTLATASLGKASTCHRMSDNRLALVFANQALHFYTMSNDRGGIADAYKVKGMIHRDQKQYTVALSLLQTSIRLNQEIGNTLNLAEAFYELAVLERNRGNHEEASRVFTNALALFTTIGAGKEAERTRKELFNLEMNKGVLSR